MVALVAMAVLEVNGINLNFVRYQNCPLRTGLSSPWKLLTNVDPEEANGKESPESDKERCTEVGTFE